VKDLIFTKKCIDTFCHTERQELEREYDKLTVKQKISPESSSPSYKSAYTRYSACVENHCMTKENIIAPLFTKIITVASEAAKAKVEQELAVILSVYDQYEPLHELAAQYKYFLKYFALASPEQRIQIIKNKTKDLPQYVVYLMAALMQDNPIEFIKTYRVHDKAAWMAALIAKM
jgi:hypothetical protein